MDFRIIMLTIGLILAGCVTAKVLVVRTRAPLIAACHGGRC
jgi:hypothetical protein